MRGNLRLKRFMLTLLLGFFQLVFLSIILSIMNVLDMCQCLTDSLTFFTAVFAAMWTYHVFLHLYAMRTAFKHRTE